MCKIAILTDNGEHNSVYDSEGNSLYERDPHIESRRGILPTSNVKPISIQTVVNLLENVVDSDVLHVR
jgi:hypothetical protein